MGFLNDQDIISQHCDRAGLEQGEEYLGLFFR